MELYGLFQVHTEKIQKEAEKDILSLICETYTVSIQGHIAQSDCRYMSDCRSRGCEFDPGLVPYFHGD